MESTKAFKKWIFVSTMCFSDNPRLLRVACPLLVLFKKIENGKIFTAHTHTKYEHQIARVFERTKDAETQLRNNRQ